MPCAMAMPRDGQRELARQGSQAGAWEPEEPEKAGAWEYRGQGQQEGHAFETYGITYVPNPYGDGRCQVAYKGKEIKPAGPPPLQPPNRRISEAEYTRATGQ